MKVRLFPKVGRNESTPFSSLPTILWTDVTTKVSINIFDGFSPLILSREQVFSMSSFNTYITNAICTENFWCPFHKTEILKTIGSTYSSKCKVHKEKQPPEWLFQIFLSNSSTTHRKDSSILNHEIQLGEVLFQKWASQLCKEHLFWSFPSAMSIALHKSWSLKPFG